MQEISCQLHLHLALCWLVAATMVQGLFLMGINTEVWQGASPPCSFLVRSWLLKERKTLCNIDLWKYLYLVKHCMNINVDVSFLNSLKHIIIQTYLTCYKTMYQIYMLKGKVILQNVTRVTYCKLRNSPLGVESKHWTVRLTKVNKTKCIWSSPGEWILTFFSAQP